MSNSYARPILRTTDLAAAMRVVQQLLVIADTSELEVDFEARISSVPTMTALMGLRPDTDWWAEGDRRGSSESGDDPLAHLPVRVRSWALPPQLLDPLIRATGGAPLPQCGGISPGGRRHPKWASASADTEARS